MSTCGTPQHKAKPVAALHAQDVTQAVTCLGGVGPHLAKRLTRLNIYTLQDLLLHVPLRYQDRTHITPIKRLRHGDQAVVEGHVMSAELKQGRRPMLLCYIRDANDAVLLLRFFHFSARQQNTLTCGTHVRCFGEVRASVAALEMVHPEYSVLRDDIPISAEEKLTPIYPATEGVQQATLRRLMEQALAFLPAMREWLPQEILIRYQLPRLPEALGYLHKPPKNAPVAQLTEHQHPAQQRLAFEELLAHHLSLRQVREKVRFQNAPALTAQGTLRAKLLSQIPFTLTNAQQRVIAEIVRDLEQQAPMLRLIQGDVGSGKTLVAAAAALHAIEAGYQVAVMAPTELLAEQHLRNFTQWLTPLGIEVGGLSGKQRKPLRRKMQERVAAGEAKLVVGTHALFQAEVNFQRLGLIIIDEQHRFGVHQRLALREKGRADNNWPHQLIMTATPIPRTLAMTAYADLDISVIDELPPGRTPVVTAVMPDSRREEIISRISEACRSGNQAYWVCTLIDESEVLQCQAAADTADLLRAVLPGLHIGLIHGRLKDDEKDQVMDAFKAGHIDVLVATTVIEVGVDVANASLMIIENAERLGLAQLHQLRGRVGRGAAKSSCVLMYHGALSEHGRARLAVMRETNDGFEIARRDLELRGPGQVLGTRQSGVLQLRIADLVRDQDMVADIQRVGRLLQDQWPEHIAPLISRWLPQQSEYANV